MTVTLVPDTSITRAAGGRIARTRLGRWRLALIALGGLALAAGIGVIDGSPVGVFHDDAMYVILARALASGRGYVYLNIPGTPAATHFPPGYPAVLALLWSLAPGFPANVVLFKTLNAVLLAVSATLVARLVRERTGSEAWGLGVGALSAVSVPLLILGSLVLSEPLFLALLLGILLHGERLVDSPGSRVGAVGLGIGIAGLSLVRSHGIVLAPAFVIVLASRRRWRDAAIIAGTAFLCLLPWQIWCARHGGTMPAPLLGNYDSYAGWWLRGYRTLGPRMIPETVSRTSSELAEMFAALLTPLRAFGAHGVTWTALGVLLGAGAWTAARRAPITLLFSAGYLAITLVWPFAPSRFIWGVWPLLLALLGMGAWTALLRSSGAHARRAAVMLSCGWLLAGYAAYEWRAARGAWWGSVARAATPRIEPAIRWTLAHTSMHDVVASEDEGALFLYTGRQAVPLFSFTSEHYLRARTTAQEVREGLEPMLAAYPVRVVIVGSDQAFEAASLLVNRASPRLARLDEFPGGIAYTVLPR